MHHKKFDREATKAFEWTRQQLNATNQEQQKSLIGKWQKKQSILSPKQKQWVLKLASKFLPYGKHEEVEVTEPSKMSMMFL